MAQPMNEFWFSYELAAVTATLCVPRSPVSNVIILSLLVRRTAQF